MTTEPNHHSNGTIRDSHGRLRRSKETAERDAEMMQMRERGLSYSKIANHFGVTKTTVSRAVERSLKAIVQEPAEAVLKLELARLDWMWDQAVQVLERDHIVVSNGRVMFDPRVPDDEIPAPLLDDDHVLRTLATMTKIMDRRARYLGLDAAQKLVISEPVRYLLEGVEVDGV
jgi:hypothetical protein